MKRPFVTGAALEAIIAKYPTPFHIYSEAGIRATVRTLRNAFSWNQGFKEYFAVKATPNPAILAILKDEGCGVDCASDVELMLAEKAGFSGQEVMFSSNVTPVEEFQLARRMGAIINLDDISHIETLEKAAGIPETVCCRFNPGGEFIVHNQVMDTPGEAKYGFTKEQLARGFASLRDKGAKNFGLHAFLASNTLGGEYYPALARLLFETAVWLQEQTGVAVSFVNLSGGVGIPYRPEEAPNDIEAIGAAVRRAYEEVMVPAGLGSAKIFTELGRFVLGPNGQMVATVRHLKHIHKDYVGLDACAANLMRPAMYKAYHHITVAGKEDAPATHLYDVTGSLCENNDKFAIDRMLPEVAVGDRLVLHDTGAHGHSMGYNYNGKLRSAEILLEEAGGIRLIRRAETPEDYFATLTY